jgi:hypothetical protein
MASKACAKLQDNETQAAKQARRAVGHLRFTREITTKLERVKGIEPSYSAWKAAALPLSYTREAVVSPASGDRTGACVTIRVAPNL